MREAEKDNPPSALEELEQWLLNAGKPEIEESAGDSSERVVKQAAKEENAEEGISRVRAEIAKNRVKVDQPKYGVPQQRKAAKPKNIWDFTKDKISGVANCLHFNHRANGKTDTDIQPPPIIETDQIGNEGTVKIAAARQSEVLSPVLQQHQQVIEPDPPLTSLNHLNSPLHSENSFAKVTENLAGHSGTTSYSNRPLVEPPRACLVRREEPSDTPLKEVS
jgi:hypothetical protein